MPMNPVTDVDARPNSEYLYHYYRHRRNYKYLYYCKDCMLSFDSRLPAEACEKCGSADIITLQKFPGIKQRKLVRFIDKFEGLKEIGLEDLSGIEISPKKIIPARKMMKAFVSEKRAGRTGRALDVFFLRFRILLHYLTV